MAGSGHSSHHLPSAANFPAARHLLRIPNPLHPPPILLLLSARCPMPHKIPNCRRAASRSESPRELLELDLRPARSPLRQSLVDRLHRVPPPRARHPLLSPGCAAACPRPAPPPALPDVMPSDASS